jgi:zinc transporter ZupT
MATQSTSSSSWNATNNTRSDDTTAHDMTPNERLDVDQGSSKPLGDAVAAALMIQLLTFSGLLVVGLTVTYRRKRRRRYRNRTDTVWQYFVDLIVPSFAVGSMLAATVFLIIPEAMDLLQGRRHDIDRLQQPQSSQDEYYEVMELVRAREKKSTWMFGTALICGFLFPMLLSAICPTPAVKTRELYGAAIDDVDVVNDIQINGRCTNERVEVTDYDSVMSYPVSVVAAPASKPAVPASSPPPPHAFWRPEKYCDRSVDTRSISDTTTDGTTSGRTCNMPLAISIVIGDMFHNLCDGLFLGTAFLLCSRSLAWIMVATTLYNQLASEMADYFVLTQHCGLYMCQALSLNVVSGSGVVLGVVLVFFINMRNEAVGAILSASAGVYLHICMGECLPRIQAVRQSGYDSLVFFTCFIVGAVPIGLILLNDVTCES